MKSFRTAVIALLLVGVPQALLACPVCFGQSDAPMARAMNMGIGFMLVVVAGMMAMFGSFFISLVRRAHLAERSEPARAQSEPQEGTAQC